MKRILVTLSAVVGFPLLVWAALPFTDAFTGTDGTALGTYSANWTVPVVAGNAQIKSNAVAPSVAAAYPYNDGAAYNNSETYNDDQYAQVVITFSGFPGVAIGPAVRLNSNGEGYQCVYLPASGQGAIRKTAYSAGNGITNTNLALDGVTATSGDTYKCKVVGNTITMERNGTQTASVTDTTFTTGQPGLGLSGSETTGAALMDTFEAGNVASAPPTNFYRLRIQP